MKEETGKGAKVNQCRICSSTNPETGWKDENHSFCSSCAARYEWTESVLTPKARELLAIGLLGMLFSNNILWDDYGCFRGSVEC